MKSLMVPLFIVLSVIYPVSPPLAWADLPFPPPVRVTDAVAQIRDRPSVVVGLDATVCTVWSDDRTGDRDVYIAVSQDGGGTFSQNVRVNDDATASEQRQADVGTDAAGRISMIWQDFRNGRGEVWFANSTDGGASFSPNVLIGRGVSPSIAVEPTGKIHAAWDYFGTMYSNSTDGGRTWTAPRRLASWGPFGVTEVPDIAVRGQDVYIVFEADGAGTWDVYMLKSTDSGATWASPPMVHPQNRTGDQRTPSIAVNPYRVAVAWSDVNGTSTGNVSYTYSDDGGATFRPPVAVHAPTPYQNFDAKIALGRLNETYVAWTANPSGNLGNDAMFAFSPDGQSFSRTIRISDTSDGYQAQPSVAVLPSGAAAVVWLDSRTGTTEVYYAEASEPIPPSVENVKVEGHPEGSAGARHITTLEPAFEWTFAAGNPGAIQDRFESAVRDGPTEASLLLWTCAQGSSQTAAVYNVTCSGGLPLLSGRDYWLRIRVQDSYGLWSPWMEVDFHINAVSSVLPVNPPPGTSRPPAQAEIIEWQSSTDPEGDPMTFDWFVDDSPLIEFPYVANGTTIGFASSAFATVPGVTYRWCVVVLDGWSVDDASCRNPWTFTAAPNGPPTPIRVSVDGFLGGGPDALHLAGPPDSFSWIASDPEGDGQAAYEVRVGTQPLTGDIWSPSAEPGGATTVAYEGPALGSGVTYRLSVRLADEHGWGYWIEVPFRLNTPPTAPSDPAPPDDHTIPSLPGPVLSWSQEPDLDRDVLSYSVEVSLTSDFLSVAHVANVSDAWTESVSVAPGTTYYWRVRSFDGWAWSEFGGSAGYWRFATEPPTVVGRVVDSSGRPLSGVLVELLSNGGTIVASVSTEHDGRFELPIAFADHYQIRASKGGYSPVLTPIFELGAGEAERDLGDMVLRELVSPWVWILLVLLVAGVVTLFIAVWRWRKRREGVDRNRVRSNGGT